MPRRRWAAILMGCAGLATVACGRETVGAQPAPDVGVVTVVATSPVVADFARVIGGDLVTVHEITADPPTDADVDALAQALVIVRSGAAFDPWLSAALDEAGAAGALVDAATGTVPRPAAPDDPYVWASPPNATIMVDVIATGLVAADRVHDDTYRANRDAFKAQIEALDADVRARLNSLPGSVLVTDHDSLGHFTDYYGITSVPLASFEDVDAFVAAVQAQGAKAIFPVGALPSAAADTLDDRAEVEVVTGDDGLYDARLGAPGTAGDTYVKMMRHNTRVIVEGLT